MPAMYSRTVLAERDLEGRLRALARERLGPNASDSEIEAATRRMQEGPQRPPIGEETYVRRRMKQRTARLEAMQSERWKA